MPTAPRQRDGRSKLPITGVGGGTSLVVDEEEVDLSEEALLHKSDSVGRVELLTGLSTEGGLDSLGGATEGASAAVLVVLRFFLGTFKEGTG